MYFTSGIEDQPHVLEAGIKRKARLIVLSRGDAIHIFSHRWQKSLKHIRHRFQDAPLLGKCERLTDQFE